MEPEINSITKNITNHSQDVTKLPRLEKLRQRNEAILVKLATGTTIEELQEEFHLCQKQIYNIIEKAEKEAKDWYQNLPKKYMMEIFRYNTNKISEEIKHLEDLRQKQKSDYEADERITKTIIESRSKLINTIADGPVLLQTEEKLSELEKFSNIHFDSKK